jgi:uncharacterized protein (TIGR02145 family)
VKRNEDIFEIPIVAFDNTKSLYTIETDHFSVFALSKPRFSDMAVNIYKTDDKIVANINVYSILNGKNVGLYRMPALLVWYDDGLGYARQVINWNKPNNVYSIFAVDLCWKKFGFSNDVLERKFLLVRRVFENGEIKGIEIYNNQNITIPLFSEYNFKDEESYEKFFQGIPLLFKFEHKPDVNEDYYLKIMWNLAGTPNYLAGSRFTYIAHVNTINESFKWNSLPISDIDKNKNGIVDSYESASITTVNTIKAEEITSTSAIVGCHVSNTSGFPILERGVCYSILQDPTINGQKCVNKNNDLGIETCLLENLQPNKKYYYRAYVITNKGTFYDNNVLEFETYGEIATPTNIYAGNWTNEKGFGVYWTDNSNDETGFIIERAVNQVNSGYQSFGSVNANINYIADNTTAESNFYCYRVAAVNSTGKSAWSKPAIIPKTPINLNASVKEKGIQLTWQDPSNSQAESFYIYRSEDGNLFQSISHVSSPTLTFTDNTVQSNKNYYYRVEAHWGGNSSNHNCRSKPSSIVGPIKVESDNTSPDGLIAHYPFDGNANDISGNGYNGTVESASLTSDRNGEPNKAYYFNGVSNRITTNFKPTNVNTISLWFNAESTQRLNAGLFSTYHSYDFRGYYWGFRSSSPNGHFFYDGNNYKSIDFPKWNTWTHLAVSSDGNTIKVFINGTLATSFSGKTTHVGNLFIGDSKYDGRFFKGKIDEIQVFNRPLSETEIKILYDTSAPAGIPPVADFTASKTTVTKGETIQFTDKSTNNPTSWLWDFGDGSAKSTQQNPTKSYQTARTYTVILQASNAFGNNSKSLTITVTDGSSGEGTQVVDVTNPATGKTWMDRNLGASRAATSSTDAEAYGDLYQWGRAADGHQKRNSATTYSLSSSDTPGHGNFILAPNSPYDWRSPQNTNLWQGVNGINNPCPTGYRLPTEAELNAERQSWSSNNSTGAYASPLKLPVAGYRIYRNGSLDVVGSGGGYWSGTVDGTGSRGLGFLSSNAGVYSGYRADGLSVRCLKD